VEQQQQQNYSSPYMTLHLPPCINEDFSLQHLIFFTHHPLKKSFSTPADLRDIITTVESSLPSLKSRNNARGIN
jgi:hypothetical protein